MKKMKLLHLSDLHLSKAHEHDQGIVLAALFNDVRELSRKGQIDAILFTGDLIAKGKYSTDSADYIKRIFLTPLLAAAKLPSNKLFLCPGNHDVDVAAADPMLQSVYSSFKGSADVNQLIDSVELRPYYWTQLKSYNNCLLQFGLSVPIISNDLFRSYCIQINDVKLGVACLNSAWRSSGKANDEDYGKLLISERQVELLHSSIADADLKIALVHHGLDYLAPFDKPAVQRSIYRNFDALLHGHNHSGDALGVATSLSRVFISNAGCLYQNRDYFNAYTLLDVSLENSQVNWTVSVREYFENRREFDLSLRFAPSGTTEITVSKNNLALDLLPTASYLDTVSEKTNSQLLSFSASDIAPKNLHGIFVEPRLSLTSEKKFNSEKTKGETVKYLSVRELTLSNCPVFFLGSKESGKTTLLNFICTKANDPSFLTKASHSVYIDFLNIRKLTQAALLEAAVNFCGGEYTKAEIKRLLLEGRMIVAFDNLPLDKPDALKLVAAFVIEYKECKFCFATEEGIEQSLNNDLIPKIGLDATVVFLHSFNRKQTRDLVGKWFSDSPEIVQEKVNLILSLIRKLSVPQTPFLISVLLWIQERNISFTPVNYSAIIDTFIDGLLEKLTEDKGRSNTDSTIKRHFLMELAYAVHISKKSRWQMGELEKFTVDYFEQKALASSTIPFITELFDKGILISIGDEACFKFDCIRAFFLSQKIGDSAVFAEYARTKSGFLELSAEIDFYTGLHRDRSEFLTEAVAILEKSWGAIGIDLDLRTFEAIELKQSILSEEVKDRIQKNVFGKRVSVHERELMFDDMEHANIVSNFSDEATELDDGDRASIDAPERTPFAEYFAILRLTSMILRNSELVSDASQKRAIYARLIVLWSEVMLLLLLTVESGAGEGEKILKMFPDVNPLMAQYMAKLTVPSVIFALVKESLGTNKLEVVIKDHLKSYRTQIEGVLSTFLYVDLALPGSMIQIEEFLKLHSANRYVSELLFFKLMSLYLFKNLSDADSNKVKALVGDMFVRLNNKGSKLVNDNIKMQFIAGLHKKDNQQALMNRIEEDGV